MSFKPIDELWARFDSESGNGAAQFNTLMYLGELALKVLVLGTIAGIDDDRDRHRYRLLHTLVRADGLGPWMVSLDDALTGPAAQHLATALRDTEFLELTTLGGSGTWQHDVAAQMHLVLSPLGVLSEPQPRQVDARYALRLFKTLRNKARAHGALTQGFCTSAVEPLSLALRGLISSCSIYDRSWGYLHRNLSGKYRFAPIAGDPEAFISLKTAAGSAGVNLEDGVYIHLGGLRRVDLVSTDLELADFFVANGHFKRETYEMLSYVTGNRATGDGNDFLVPAEQLPASETEGDRTLSVQGRCFANLPETPKGYVQRPALEAELLDVLTDTNRHPVVTLVGRGGIGKTSTALAVLRMLCSESPYEAIFWFSARDIDLLDDGPSPVRRQVLGQKDVAEIFVALMNPSERADRGFKATDYLGSSLGASPLGGPLLFVFDNFETVRNPAELYQWLDGFVRNPNKILITTRHRDFKADYPVEVRGMESDEFAELVASTASALRIEHHISDALTQSLYTESDGHPYVAKVFLGEIAKKGEVPTPKHLMRGKEDILEALFERSYALLSPAARRIFLTLSNWRSAVPVLALEAVIASSAPEPIDVRGAVDELERSSFVLVVACNGSPAESLVAVPLVAGVFGDRKLQVDAAKTQVEVDTRYLQMMGAASIRETAQGIGPRIARLFGNVADNVNRGTASMEASLPVLEYIASRYSDAWRMLADLYMELGGASNAENAKNALRRYLESNPPSDAAHRAWLRLERFAWQTGDQETEFAAWLRIVEFPQTSFYDLSTAANAMSRLLQGSALVADPEVKRTAAKKVAEAMEALLPTSDPTADDYSRLAWLYLYRSEPDKARTYVDEGLRLDEQNPHCRNLMDNYLNRNGSRDA